MNKELRKTIEKIIGMELSKSCGPWTNIQEPSSIHCDWLVEDC